MTSYIIKRLLSGILTIWFVATATFAGMHAIPGDPLLNTKAMPADIRSNLEARYGLDKPLTSQYFIYLGKIVQGDFGISFTQQNRRVNDIIREHFPVSAALGLIAIFYAFCGGVLWGALTAHYRGQYPDIIIMLMVIVSISIPSFVFATLGQLFILKFNHWLGYTVIPIAGWGTVKQMILPALVLGLGTLAYLTRLMRSSMLEVSSADYIRTARSKGLSSIQIFFNHQLRNAVLPLVTVLGPTIATISTGGFVVELVFAIPGLGRYFVQAVQQLDYTVIMGTTVFYGAFLVLMVVLVDILYGFIDPRIRLKTP